MISARFDDTILEEKLLTLPRDEMAIFVMADGLARGALFHGTRFVNQMRSQHKLGVIETMILGQASLCGALMIPIMKDRGRMSWKYEVDGVAKGFSIDAFSDGFVRGYLFNKNIDVDSPLDEWDLSKFLGTGTMTISSLRENDTEPYSSSVEATHKNIAEDLVWYFKQSEQIQTAFDTSILMDKEGRVTGAGGLFLQVMPDAGGTRRKCPGNIPASDEDIIAQMEDIVQNAASFGKMFAAGKTTDEIIYELFADFSPKIAVRRNITWFCPCTKEMYATHLRGMPKDVRDDLKKDENIEITCQNCGSVYSISADEL